MLKLTKTQVYKNAIKDKHEVMLDNFKILSAGYNNMANRKIAEASWI